MKKISEAKTSIQSNFTPSLKNNFCSIKRMDIPNCHNRKEHDFTDKFQFKNGCYIKNCCCECRNSFVFDKEIEKSYYRGEFQAKNIKKFKKH